MTNTLLGSWNDFISWSKWHYTSSKKCVYGFFAEIFVMIKRIYLVTQKLSTTDCQYFHKSSAHFQDLAIDKMPKFAVRWRWWWPLLVVECLDRRRENCLMKLAKVYHFAFIYFATLRHQKDPSNDIRSQSSPVWKLLEEKKTMIQMDALLHRCEPEPGGRWLLCLLAKLVCFCKWYLCRMIQKLVLCPILSRGWRFRGRRVTWDPRATVAVCFVPTSFWDQYCSNRTS